MSRERVLIIDDDPDFCAAVRALLESGGYTVARAATGREGLEAARRLPPQLILLDVMMEERTAGFFLLRDLRRVPALRRIPVIVISSIYTDTPRFRIRPEAGWLPADLYLPKPIEPGRLLREIRRLLDGQAARPVPVIRGAER